MAKANLVAVGLALNLLEEAGYQVRGAGNGVPTMQIMEMDTATVEKIREKAALTEAELDDTEPDDFDAQPAPVAPASATLVAPFQQPPARAEVSVPLPVNVDRAALVARLRDIQRQLGRATLRTLAITAGLKPFEGIEADVLADAVADDPAILARLTAAVDRAPIRH